MQELSKTLPNKKFSVDPRAWKGAAVLGGFTILASIIAVELAIVPAILFACHILFFRDPSFELPEGDPLVSPAYGRVADIEIVREDKYIHEDCYRIGIFMSVLNPHVTRSPLPGKIGYLEHVPGKFINAMLKNSSLKNESNWIGIENLGLRVMVRQITGAIARRIFWDVQLESNVDAGEKLGVICYGSRVECFLPVRYFKPSVKIGDKVKAGETMIGEKLS